MKMLVLTSQVFQLGGAEKLALELVQGLNDAGVEADLGIVFDPDSGQKSNADILTEMEKAPGNWFSLGIKPHPAIADVFRATISLIRIIRQRHYTHIETSLVTPSVIATLASIFTGVRHIVGFHNSYQPSLTRGANYKLFFWLSRFARNNIYYGISDFVVSSWRLSGKVKMRSLITIYNGVSKDFVSNQAGVDKNSVYGDSRCVLLYVGRITKHKGYHILFDAVKHILKPADAALYFIGHPDEQTENEQEELNRVQAEVVNLGLENHVFFLGFVTPVIDYISTCDLLIHPTALEGFGLVLIEAMLLKKPIITTNVEAIPEILEGTGISQLPYGDVEGLRDMISRFIENKQLFNDAVQKGSKRARYFSLENRVQNIVNYAKS